MSYSLVYDSRRWVRSDSTDVTIVLPIAAGGTGNTTGTATINANLTGPVTSVGNATTITAGAVTLAMQANMATASVVYRKTAGSGAPEVNTLATLKTDLGLTGTNSGDQTITLTGPITGSGTGSFATAIASQTGTGSKFVMDTSPTFAGQVGIGSAPNAAVTLLVKGASATSADYVFAAQNTVDNLLLVRDDGTITFGVGTGTGVMTPTGDYKLPLVGGGFYVKEGTNATMGTAVLVLGVKVVSTTKVTANSRIFLSAESLATITAPVALAVTARTPGTSFTITSANLTDTSTIAWIIIEPS